MKSVILTKGLGCRYISVLTHLYNNDGGAEGASWSPVEGTNFIFHDGTSSEPMPRRETSDAHFISAGIFVVGNFVGALSLLFALGCALWVILNRKSRVVKASQPEFLLLLCLGAFLVSLSAVAHFDEDKGLSKRQLNIACGVQPWFFILGYLIMYCALFSKLWRISQLLQLRRQAVHIQKTLIPFAIFTALCVVVLSVWQAIDPLKWRRTAISTGEEPYETYGECSSTRYGNAPFLIPLSVLIFVAVSLTGWLSWKMRNVQSELAESRWIFAGIYIHIQTWVVGIPLLFITNGVSKDAFYLMMVAWTSTFANSLVGLVICPKMYQLHAVQPKQGEAKKANSPGLNTTTSTQHNASHRTDMSAREAATTNSRAPTVDNDKNNPSSSDEGLTNEQIKHQVIRDEMSV